MTSLQKAISATINYAIFFGHSLTLKELHHWLISPQLVSSEQIEVGLPKTLAKKINSQPQLRQQKSHLTRKKINSTTTFVHFLKLIPTIRLVAVTGSLAMNNAAEHDDIDFMIITHNHTLWLTRPLVTFIASFFGRRKPSKSQDHSPDSICLNLWLDTQSLAVPEHKRNLYTAHEVLQVKPLLDRNHTHQQFLRANTWTSQHLANAHKQLIKQTPPLPRSFLTLLLAPFNLLAYLLQYLYMKNKITREYITLHSAYFHPRSFSKKVSSFLNQNT